MKSFRLPLTMAFLLSASFVCCLRAQTLTLIEPASRVTVPDGDEFATAFVHRPWNMERLRDIPLDVGFGSIGVENGIWTGVSSDPVYYVFPLSPGFLRPDYLSYWAWYTDGMPYGPLNLLDASKYSRISFRMSLPEPERNYVSIWWARRFNTWPTEEANFINWYDGEPTLDDEGRYAVLTPHDSGFRIYDIDPGATTWMDGRNPLHVEPPATKGLPWSGMIYGFFIWPSDRGGAGTEVSFDWIRAYDPEISPVVPIRWRSSGLDETYDSIQLFVDTGNSGFNGDLLVSGLIDDGRYDLKTAALPPGDYYVYLKAVRHESSTLKTLATSDYSGLIRIAEPPVITIVAPGFTSGRDYATTELNNPWDFEDDSDVEFTDHMSDISYENGIFSAITDEPVPPHPESDNQIWLNTRRDGVIIPIDTRKYRYFTHRMKVREEPGYGDIFDKVARGWLSRITWWNAGMGIDGSHTKDIPLLEGWRDYTVDLWDSTLLEVKEDTPAIPQIGWREIGSARHIRLDPLESHFPTRFWLDYVMLTAENTLSEGSYKIEWEVEAPGSESLTVEIFADPETLSGQVLRSADPIGIVGQGPGRGSFVWRPAERIGRYYVRLRVSDEIRTTEKTSRVPVVMSTAPTSPAIPAPGDYDGDGITDVVFYEPAAGMWHVQLSSEPNPIFFEWGDPLMVPVSGDFDGDGKSDPALYHEASGLWYVLLSGRGYELAWAEFGGPGFVPVSGDFDGDGKSDPALYHEASGTWRALLSGSGYAEEILPGFGGAGWLSAPGDFDGDGKTDPAIYYEGTGDWQVILSGSGYGEASLAGFGGPGWQPVSGDFDGDGKSDPALYHEASGLWYVLLSGRGYELAWAEFGGPGHQPVTGDFSGDGRTDPALYHETTGAWNVLTRPHR